MIQQNMIGMVQGFLFLVGVRFSLSELEWGLWEIGKVFVVGVENFGEQKEGF